MASRAFAKAAKPNLFRRGVFQPTKEKLFQLQNGYFLLYYHRQKWYTIGLLCARFTIPMLALAYLIRKNPFYRTYPIMLPVMIIGFGITMYRFTKYTRKTNHMIH